MRRRLCNISLILLLSSMVVAASATPSDARPFPREGSFEIGLQLGGLFFLDKDAVPYDSEGPAFPERLIDTFAYTLTGGYNFTRMFGAELALQLSPAEANRLSVFNIHLDFIVHPFDHDWFVPFVGVGPTFSTLIPQDGDLASDADPGVNVVLGMKLYPWNNVGFRVDLRYVARFATASDTPDGRSEVMGHDLIASLGLMVTLGGEVEKEPIILDTDGDGIPDHEDKCPTVPGVASAQGCPDADGDGIPDDEDRCPHEPGPAEFQGCPDTDGDGIPDIDDRCPTEPGPAELQGCPDTDGDGIPDIDDRCPKIPGVPEYQGCPPPPPDDVVKRFTGTIEGITFAVDSDEIRPTSFEVLDQAARLLGEYPALRLLIEGHTSAEGSYQHNVDLSQRRADSVKRYLVDKGVAEDRLETKGFGPDRPVAPNDTEANRAKNRRIEFQILRQ